MRNGKNGSHWDGCWKAHHDCAIAEIERLTAVSNIAIQQAARWLFAFRDRESHAPDYVSHAELEKQMRCMIEREAAKSLGRSGT